MKTAPVFVWDCRKIKTRKKIVCRAIRRKQRAHKRNEIKSPEIASQCVLHHSDRNIHKLLKHPRISSEKYFYWGSLSRRYLHLNGWDFMCCKANRTQHIGRLRLQKFPTLSKRAIPIRDKFSSHSATMLIMKSEPVYIITRQREPRRSEVTETWKQRKKNKSQK